MGRPEQGALATLLLYLFAGTAQGLFRPTDTTGPPDWPGDLVEDLPQS